MFKKEFKNISLLYVDDENNIRKSAVSYFKRLFDEVYEAKDAYDALELIKNKNPNIIITDIKMPKMSGLELIKKIKEFNQESQILVLSAFTDTKYLLEAVELGLVKYLVKPIRHDKMLPVLLTCAKNIKNEISNLRHISKSCYFDGVSKKLINEGSEVKLSKNELSLLELLCSSNRLVSYEEMENKIWYDSVMSEDAIRSLIRNLRRKLPRDTLKNISKVGYRIETFC